MTHFFFAKLKSTIKLSLSSFLAIVLAIVSLLAIPSANTTASAETVISQLGGDIDGETAGDQSGYSVALSSDGSRVAIGAHQNDGNGTEAGHVRIYDLVGGTWTQVGADINGEAAGDESGFSVSLSSDGSTVAIGAHLNDGKGSNAGHVRVYGLVGGTWTQVGADIDGEATEDRSGWSVALSSDGLTVAIGARQNGGVGSRNAGHVRIYEYNGSSWTQVGGDIDGEAAADYSGDSVSLSSDGSTVAISAQLNDGNGRNAGHVRIYEYNGSSWTQVGGDIDGEAADDNSGYSVSLSSDGSRVAIGALYNDGNGDSAGHVRIYEYNGSSWTQVGGDIDGEAAWDLSGRSVSLSSDGSTVAIGAQLNDGNGSEAGHVRVFSAIELEAALIPTFATPTQTSDGFTVQISNYDDNYSWTASASAGSAEISGSGLITVTGLSAGAPSTVTVGTARSGYSSGSADESSSAFTTLTPTFATPTKTSDGYTVQLSNYDANFTWNVSASVGSAAIGGSGLITVTGLSAGASSTVTVQTTRTGYTAGSATETSSALEAALTPTFATPTKTSDGYTVQVSNYDANFTWNVSASVGSAAIGGSGLISVTGLSAGASSTVTVQTTRSGYTAGSATVASSALDPAPSGGSAGEQGSQAAAYSGPTFDAAKTVAAGSEVTFTGRRLQLVSSAYAGQLQLQIVQAVSSSLTVFIPTSLSANVYDLTVHSSNGKLTFQQGLTVLGAQDQIVGSEAGPKLTVGSFKGYVAIYTKGYEGQRLSAKVDGKWLVVDPLKESWRQNNYSRTVRFIGAGYDIFVHLYIDGEFIKTEMLTTK